jgi:polysaccharide export outer membrane protein
MRVVSLSCRLALAAVLVCGGPLLAQSQAPPPADQAPRPGMPLTGEYRIGAEDVLAIVVLGQPDYSRIVPVRPDGKISLPQVNDVEAAGLTASELRAELTKRFQKFIREQVLEVSVIVTEVNSPKVSVLGQVRTNLRFVLRTRTTLLEAIAMAGGFTEFAKRDRITVLRGDATATFNYDRFVEHPVGAENLVLKAGDIIIVP